jgi:hypothetical protein
LGKENEMYKRAIYGTLIIFSLAAFSACSSKVADTTAVGGQSITISVDNPAETETATQSEASDNNTSEVQSNSDTSAESDSMTEDQPVIIEGDSSNSEGDTSMEAADNPDDSTDDKPSGEETISDMPSEQKSTDESQPKTDSSNESSSNTDSGVTESAVGTVAASDMVITVNSIDIKTGIDFTSYINKVGSNVNIEEGQACLEGGFDTNYYYGDTLSVYTIASGGKQIVYDVYTTTTGYSTAKGIKIGTSTKDDVYKAYGDPSSSHPTNDVYTVGDISLSFEYEDGIVSGIDVCDTSIE